MQLSKPTEAGVEDQNSHRLENQAPAQPQQKSGGMRDESSVKINLPKRRPSIKVGRNEPCACGSGKKAKSCCGAE